MPDTIAPPPPAPSPAPAAAPPAPKSTPLAPPGAKPSFEPLPAPGNRGLTFKDGDNDPFADIPRHGKPPTPQPTPKPTEPPPATPTKAAEPTTVAPKPGEPPKTPDKPVAAPAADQDPSKATGPKWFRDAIAKRDGELSTATNRIKELETQLSATKPAPEVDALTQTLAAKDKELTEVRERLGSLQFTESADFKSKYVEPFERAYKFAVSRLKGVQVTNPDGTARPATSADFQRVYQTAASNVGEASKLAEETFGPSAPWVMNRVDELQRMQYEHDSALEGERSVWETRNKESAAKLAQTTQANHAMFRKVTDDMVSKHPEWFGERADDPEGNELLQKGLQMADGFFVHGKTLTPQQQTTTLANIRLRAAAFGRLVNQNGKLQDQLAERDSIIAELRGSAPGGTPAKHPSETPAAPGKDDMWSDFDRTVVKGQKS